MTQKDITWREFKELVEAAGIQDDQSLAWIDWESPRAIKVKRYPNGSVKVLGGDFPDEEE